MTIFRNPSINTSSPFLRSHDFNHALPSKACCEGLSQDPWAHHQPLLRVEPARSTTLSSRRILHRCRRCTRICNHHSHNPRQHHRQRTQHVAIQSTSTPPSCLKQQPLYLRKSPPRNFCDARNTLLRLVPHINTTPGSPLTPTALPIVLESRLHATACEGSLDLIFDDHHFCAGKGHRKPPLDMLN